MKRLFRMLFPRYVVMLVDEVYWVVDANRPRSEDKIRKFTHKVEADIFCSGYNRLF